MIGAGSVVTKDCADNGVYAGNPAVRICDLDTYCKRREAAQLSEAKKLAQEYYKRYDRRPPEEIFHEYFMLFEDLYSARCKRWCQNKMKVCGNFDDTVLFMSHTHPKFENYEAFMKYCFEEDTNQEKGV